MTTERCFVKPYFKIETNKSVPELLESAWSLAGKYQDTLPPELKFGGLENPPSVERQNQINHRRAHSHPTGHVSVLLPWERRSPDRLYENPIQCARLETGVPGGGHEERAINCATTNSG